jgi:uncharacterized UPF0146 family protein
MVDNNSIMAHRDAVHKGEETISSTMVIRSGIVGLRDDVANPTYEFFNNFLSLRSLRLCGDIDCVFSAPSASLR